MTTQCANCRYIFNYPNACGKCPFRSEPGYYIPSPWTTTKERYDELNRSPFNVLFASPIIPDISKPLTRDLLDQLPFGIYGYDIWEEIAGEMLKGYKDE